MKAADEPVFASARKETVEDPIGTLIPVVVPEWPVAVEEVARAAAAATVVTNVTVVEVFEHFQLVYSFVMSFVIAVD